MTPLEQEMLAALKAALGDLCNAYTRAEIGRAYPMNPPRCLDDMREFLRNLGIDVED